MDQEYAVEAISGRKNVQFSPYFKIHFCCTSTRFEGPKTSIASSEGNSTSIHLGVKSSYITDCLV